MIEKAIFGGGCFWCIDAVFRKLKGVNKVISGYTGGSTNNPDYHSVCSGDTGHAEVVEIDFNTEEISYDELLDIFFAIHDPTTFNKQGNDAGTQYRSVIYYINENQKETILKKIASLEKSNSISGKIVTEISPAEKFFPAEDYHQDYYNLNPSQPYCKFLIAPKLQKFASSFADKIKV